MTEPRPVRPQGVEPIIGPRSERSVRQRLKHIGSAWEKGEPVGPTVPTKTDSLEVLCGANRTGLTPIGGSAVRSALSRGHPAPLHSAHLPIAHALVNTFRACPCSSVQRRACLCDVVRDRFLMGFHVAFAQNVLTVSSKRGCTMLKTNLSVSIKPPLREALKAAAEREELSVSSLVRRTLAQRFMPAPASRDQGSSTNG